MIEDLNSANGTFVNGQRVKVSSLKEESLINIGASRFLFKLQNTESIISTQNLIGAKISDGYDAVISGLLYY